MLCECGCGEDAGVYAGSSTPKRFLFNHDKANRGLCKHGHLRTPDNIVGAGRCKACARAVSKQWQKDHPNSYKFTQIKLKYGITEEQFNGFLESQGNCCAICRAPFGEKELPCVDHDHACCPRKERACGKCVRGLICRTCNAGLGSFRDNATTLSNAIQYLNKFKETQCSQNLSSELNQTVQTATA